MPYVGTVTTSPVAQPAQYLSTFSHSNETAYAGYYKVKLDNGVTTELTTTQRTGAARFTYPAGQTAALLLNVSSSVSGVSYAQAHIGTDSISGFVTVDGSFCPHRVHYTAYFFARFSQPFARYGLWHDRSIATQKTSLPFPSNQTGAYVTFSGGNNVITASVGLSFVSVANAQENLDSENASGNFDASLAQAEIMWNASLRKIMISGGTLSQTSTFYTALYHSLLYPSIFSDENRQYIGFDGKTHTVPPGHNQYANYSGWDIYRSEVQLLTLLDPQQTSDMAQSLVNDYVQSGHLPRWVLANQDLYDMPGDSADAIIADIYAFGGTNFDTTTALSAMIRQATKPNVARKGLAYLISKGYLPVDGNYGFSRMQGTAETSLEYNVDDFSLGLFAQALGDTKDYQFFVNRAQNWKNLVNPKDRYLEARYLDGHFAPSPYNPTSLKGWIESNGAQYTWMVQFNLGELFQALGGNKVVVSRLNTFFTQFNGGLHSPYAFMGNEPSLEIPWEYDYAGTPYRTQDVARAIENALYTTGSGGLDGNDDLGETSSWYVWAALGMYPETPGTANLVLSSPLFPSITITRQSGQTITINAPHASADTYYVQSLTVNGAVWNTPWLPPSFLASSGTLSYILATTANTRWGADTIYAPPSYGSVADPRSSVSWPSS